MKASIYYTLIFAASLIAIITYHHKTDERDFCDHPLNNEISCHMRIINQWPEGFNE
jgi:hypothetical protein